jgi:nicotinamidase-related amidase
MDIQVGVVERFANDADLLKRIGGAISATRSIPLPVISVGVSFRKGYPEISPQNKSFSAIKASSFSFQDGTSATHIHPAIAPQPADILITKRRVSAFSGSNLEVVLRAQEIRHLVLCGIATNGVVLSTLREAADKDYELTVLSDCCTDSDEEVHRVLISKIFPRQAHVVTVQEWSTALKR